MESTNITTAPRSAIPQDPWTFTNTLPLKDPASGAEYLFSTPSRGGIQAVGKLCNAFGAKTQVKPNVVPVISLDCGSYKHKQFGQVYFPVFRVIKWTTEEELVSGEKASIEDDLNDSVPF